MDQLVYLKDKLEINLETIIDYDVFYGSLIIFPSTLLIQTSGEMENRQKEFLAYMVDSYILDNENINDYEKSKKSNQIFYLLQYLTTNSTYWESKYLLTLKNIITKDTSVKNDVIKVMKYLNTISNKISQTEKEQIDFVKEFLDIENNN